MSSNIAIKYLKAICIVALLTGMLVFIAHPFPIDENETYAILTGNQKDHDGETQLQGKSPKILRNEKIVIATVACSANNNAFIYEEALVMLKSVLISATQNNVDKLEFHIYLEDLNKQSYYFDSFKKFGFPPNESMLTLHFHSAMNIVPEKYSSHMIYHPRFRCGYVRAFFPTVLPMVDSILYLDTDIIITGDILKIWAHLYDMKENQLIGVGYNNEEEDKNYGYLDKYQFGGILVNIKFSFLKKLYCDIPHVKPKGINNGVILMNLTKMREFEWEEKLLNLYDAYSQVIKRMTVQRLMNILLYYNPGLLYILTCEFHFIHTHCDKGLTCQHILNDTVGIHLIHGANKKFEENGTFQQIFSSYNKFNMITGDVLKDIYYPIRTNYQSNRYLGSPCNRVLADNLFKNV